jgi:hypothetical protein
VLNLESSALVRRRRGIRRVPKWRTRGGDKFAQKAATDPPSDLRRRLELTWGAVNWFVGSSAVALANVFGIPITGDSAAQLSAHEQKA